MRSWTTIILSAGLIALVASCGSKPNAGATAPTGPDLEVVRILGGTPDPSAPPATPTSDAVATTEDVVPPPPAITTASPASPTPTASTSDIRDVDFAGFEHEVGTLKGKFVVIDCWATWCGICKEKFPKYVDLQRKHLGKTNVIFASLANDPIDKIDEVREFLAGTGSSMTCYLLDEDPADFAVKFQVDGVPAYLVYSPTGELIFKSGKIEELDIKLDELLSAQPN